MIYLTKGIRQSHYSVGRYSKPDFSHLVEATRTPQEAFNQTAEQLAEYKKNEALYVIHGTVAGMKRKDEVINRTILFIDVDDESNYKNASKRLDDLFEAYDINHVIYPTISNCIKDGARLRVGVALDRPVNADEYLKLWRVILVNVGLHGDDTAVNHSFKQLQGLYIKTSQNSSQAPIIYDSGQGLPVDEFIKIYDSDTAKYEQQKPAVATASNDDEDIPNYAKTNKRMIATLLDPEANYQLFGGWDNMLTALAGWTYKQSYGDFIITADVVEATNNKGSDPIEEQELIKKFKTWGKGWTY